MTQYNLDDFDLNLLLSLNTLLSIKHVSKAAEEMGLTQSGMSKNLARLRDHFQDDLLVRTGNQMVLTPTAEKLTKQVETVLGSVNSMLTQKAFDPRNTEMQFCIVASDFLMQLYFPGLVKDLLKRAPLMALDLKTWSDATFQELESGEVDFLFTSLSDAPAGVYRRALKRSSFVCITRRKHPLFKNKFTLENYLIAKHISIKLSGKGVNPIDAWLKSQGVARQVSVATPYFMSGIAMASQSDLVMIASADLAERAKKHYPIDIHEIPLPLEMPPFGMYWHERTKKSEQHLWFRKTIVEILGLEE